MIYHDDLILKGVSVEKGGERTGSYISDDVFPLFHIPHISLTDNQVHWPHDCTVQRKMYCMYLNRNVVEETQ